MLLLLIFDLLKCPNLLTELSHTLVEGAGRALNLLLKSFNLLLLFNYDGLHLVASSLKFYLLLIHFVLKVKMVLASERLVLLFLFLSAL